MVIFRVIEKLKVFQKYSIARNKRKRKIEIIPQVSSQHRTLSYDLSQAARS